MLKDLILVKSDNSSEEICELIVNVSICDHLSQKEHISKECKCCINFHMRSG
jgi:hypothetical protein